VTKTIVTNSSVVGCSLPRLLISERPYPPLHFPLNTYSLHYVSTYAQTSAACIPEHSSLFHDSEGLHYRHYITHHRHASVNVSRAYLQRLYQSQLPCILFPHRAYAFKSEISVRPRYTQRLGKPFTLHCQQNQKWRMETYHRKGCRRDFAGKWYFPQGD